jgi:hypothetical protein
MTTAAAVSATTTFADLLAQDAITQPQLAAHLDALDSAERVRQCRALSGKAQKRLWQVCADASAFALDDLIPSAIADGQTVIYAGKNSLAMFTHFEKRFVRQGGAVVGYNHQSMSFVTGPGYFTVTQAPAKERARELLFDYTRVPPTAPSGWPAIKPNESGLSRFVYKNLHDFCRRVSRDVIIGSATRVDAQGAEQDMDSYFVLARA